MSVKAKLKGYGHILIAVILACTAGVMYFYYVKMNTPSQNVIVAATGLPVGITVTPDTLKDDLYPRSKMPADAITKREDVVGKVVTVGVLEGNVVRNGNLTAGKGALSVRLATMAPGRVSVDLPPDTALGLSGGVVVGDHVNVHSEMAVVDPSGKSVATVTGKVAKDAIVIGVPNAKTSKQPGPVEKGNYIIAVKPEEEDAIGDDIVRGKKFSLFLLPPTKGGQQ